ncbi:glycolate oxidase [Desulfovibrionales bacterium]
MDIHRLTIAQQRFLTDTFSAEDCLLTPEEMLVFRADASRLVGIPLAVVRPVYEDQVQLLFAWAQIEGVPLYPRARATNLVGGCVPYRPGVVISTLKLDHIVDITPDDFVAVVEPGVITGRLQVRLETQGLFYPPDPASVQISTIGGNVATCAGGMCAVKYGVTRDYVLGLRAVLPGGDVITPGGRSHKNVVGLDLVRLFVGSEGTLGMITQLTLKLLPKPEATASVLVGFSTEAAALTAAGRVFNAGILPVALEFMNIEVLDCLGRLGPVPWPGNIVAVLLLRLDGYIKALPLEVARVAAVLRESGADFLVEGVSREAEALLWELRRNINPASFLVRPHKFSDDIAVPRGLINLAVTGIRAIGERYKLPILIFGHLGDGNLHVNVMHDADAPGERERGQLAKAAVMDLALSLGGTLSGEHGMGLSKVDHVARQLEPRQIELMRDIKRLFDPRGILNPGKAF